MSGDSASFLGVAATGRISKRHTISGDLALAARLWRIWLRLGVQDVRRRFRRSVLGAAWIFLQLAIMILALGVIYGALLKQDLTSFLPFLTVSLIAWGYLTSSVTEGGQAFIASEGYVKQIGLPIYVYVFRFFVSISITAAISSLAYVAVAVVLRVPLGWGVLWAVPGIFLFAVVSFLLTTIFAYVTTRFRDAAYMAAAGLQVLFYVTPVIWRREMLRSHGLDWVVRVNPLYHLLEVVRRPLLDSHPASAASYLVTLLLVVALAGGAWVTARVYHRRIVYFL